MPARRFPKPTSTTADTSYYPSTIDVEDVGEWCPACDAEGELEWYAGSARCMVCDAAWPSAEELGFDQFDARLRAQPVLAADKKPYGDVEYADPGYQDDGVSRYPIDTAEHVRAAWSYINQADNAAKYDGSQVDSIKSKIKSKAKELGVEIKSASRKVAVAECPDCGSTNVRERPDGEYACKDCSRVFEGSRRKTASLDWDDDDEPVADVELPDSKVWDLMVQIDPNANSWPWWGDPDTEVIQAYFVVSDDWGNPWGASLMVDVGAMEQADCELGTSFASMDAAKAACEAALGRVASRRKAKAYCWDCDKAVADGESGQPCPDCGEPMSPVSKADADGPDDHKDAHCAGSEEWHPSPGRIASMTICSSCGWSIWPTIWRPGLGGYLPPHTSTINGVTATAAYAGRRKIASSGFFVDPPLPVDEFKSVMQAGGLTVTNGDRPTDLLTEAPDGFVHWNVYEGTVNYGERFGGNSADTACDVLYNAGYDIVWEGDEGFDELMNS